MPGATANMLRLTAAALTGQDEAHVCRDDLLGCTLQPAVSAAFSQMRSAASNAGLNLQAVSGFRSFERQLRIWNEKFLGTRPVLSRAGLALAVEALEPEARIDAILQWSALPGASRHHWGTDLDVIDRAAVPAGAQVRLIPAEYAAGGWFAPLDIWLRDHAADFGFFRPYDRDRGGVQPEPWHLSFAPLATSAQQALTAAVLATTLGNADLQGRDLVLARLEELHQRFVQAVAPPPAAAIAAQALSRAATPS
jgi:LAS superfamily LD-carboxypeptidase LdcB